MSDEDGFTIILGDTGGDSVALLNAMGIMMRRWLISRWPIGQLINVSLQLIYVSLGLR